MDIEEELDELEVDAQPSEEELAAQKEAEDEARKYGWRPKEEFDRDPEGWVDASRFLELPSTNVKMLRDTKRELEGQLADLKKSQTEEISRIQAVSKKATERQLEREKAAYEAKLRELQAGQRKAVEEADTEAFDNLRALEAEHRKHEPQPEPEMPGQPQQQPQIDPLISSYVEQHEWAKNPLLWGEATQAVEYGLRSKQIQPDNTQAQIDYAESVMKAKYPHLFAKPESRVETGGLATGAPRNKGVDDLPADAKRIGKEYVEDGVYKNMAEYAADYWSEA